MVLTEWLSLLDDDERECVERDIADALLIVAAQERQYDTAPSVRAWDSLAMAVYTAERHLIRLPT